jgi:hypothetical protein
VLEISKESQRSDIASAGVTIAAIGPDWLEIMATPAQIAALQAQGYQVDKITTVYLPLIIASGAEPEPEVQRYKVLGVTNKFQRTEIVRIGVVIHGIESDWVEILAFPDQVEAVKALGYQVEPTIQIQDFPAADSNYLNYSEMVAAINQVSAQFPNIVTLFSVGQSYQGRTLWAIKISDNPTVDEPEPEVLFSTHLHALEHLTVEQAVYIMRLLTDEYNLTPQITNLVNTREIFIIFDANPDGGEYDIATGTYRSWRKNRQPAPGSTSIGYRP